MLIEEEEYDNHLAHYGILRRSGRYPWGSGKDENTRNKIFLDHINGLRKDGLKDKDIAELFDCTQNELRAARSQAREQQKQADIAMAQRLRDKGMGNSAIGERMGKPESTVRTLLAPGAENKARVLTATGNMLKDQVAEKGFVDVGKGNENYLGISQTRLNNTLIMLQEQGYAVHTVKTPQLGTDKETSVKVLCPPGTTWGEAMKNRDKIQSISDFSQDGGQHYSKVHDPLSVDPKRIGVVYKEQGGDKQDGVIHVRPGVDDLYLGGVNYAQVRVKVGDEQYLKGMALYKDDMPAGKDLVFHTAKSDTGNKLDAMKNMADHTDPFLPFGSVIRQITENPGTPKERLVSAMNIVNDDTDWEKWSRTLSPQFLSKQQPVLAQTQLDMTYERRLTRYKDIMSLTNNTVKKKMLEDFAGECDSASVHMKAAALPHQSVKVLLPVPSLKVTEVYAPSYLNGTRVILIRHPHGGTFELPDLTVNNKNREAIKLIGKDASTAIGINHEVAKKLSGADFDGDTVLVVPNTSNRITSTRTLDALKNFDPHTTYKGYEGMKVMKNTQTEMGKISNLITDMTIRNASHDEIARAVKHSMVVIDAEKKKLNYKLSYNDNNIKELKTKYQKQEGGGTGAATLLSRAKAPINVPHRQERPARRGGKIDPTTGEIVYEPTGKVSYKTGQPRTMRSKKLAEAKDAHTLSSGTPIEKIYANHSNKLKALANQARLEAYKTPRSVYSPSAKKVYAKQVDSLNAKLAVANSNKPRERQAQLAANAHVRARRDANPTMDKATEKKVKIQALNEYRARNGVKKLDIEIDDEEWQAIQQGAISDSKLSEILKKSNMETVHKHAAPHVDVLMTSPKTARAKQMLALGYTRAEVAAQLGVSLTTLDTATK